MFVNRQKPQIEKLLRPLLEGHAAHICIIDPPGHPNVGDHAIFLGELDFIAEHFPSSRVSCFDVDSYSASVDPLIEQATIILIHGGGNFGDIWPAHHGLRTQIIKNFSHKKIVQLPQSVHFNNEAELRRTADLIDRHKDFHLIVRDRRSHTYAKARFSCPVMLAPDMAFAMKPIKRRHPIVDYLCLLRTDKEAICDHLAITETLAQQGKSIEVADWVDNPRTWIMNADVTLARLIHKYPNRTAPLRSVAVSLRRAYATQRVAHGIALLSRGRHVVTDRLHAHIMCTLMDIPHFVFDSYDGKISALNETWLRGYPSGAMISSPLLLAARLLEVP
jgi:exopolysaccharide biosynthesis predicted pyruvyltransferase EpsI